MAQQPDIRVKLSPEGVQEVISALKKVRQEGEQAARRAGSGVGVLNNQLASLKALLPALSIGAAVIGFQQLTKATLDLGDQLFKLSQRTGISVEELSELAHAGNLADVPVEALSIGLKKLAVNMADAARDTGDAKDAFKALGISVTNADGSLKSSNQVMLEVADRFAAMEDGAGKTALAVKIFGRAGDQMIPLLNQGSAGLRENAEEARKLGIVWSTDLARKAEELNDNLTRLKQAFIGMAREGIIDAAIPALNEFIESLLIAIKELGFFQGLLARTTLSGGEVENAAVELQNYTEKLRKAREEREKFNKMGTLQRAFSFDDIKILDAQIALFEAKTKALEAVLLAQGNAQPDNFDSRFNKPARAPAPKLPDPQADQKALKAAQARVAAEKAALDNEFKLFQAQNKLLESQDKIRFDQGLISLKEYYQRRLALTTSELDKEIAILEQKRRLTEETPTDPKDPAQRERLRQEVAALENQIAIKRVERNKIVGELSAQEQEALKRLASERARLEQSMLTAIGDRKAAALAALEEEIKKTDELLRKQGASDAERNRITGQQREVGTRNIEFEEQVRQGDLALRELELRRQQIEGQVKTGILFEFEGRNKIIELQKQQLPILKAIADEMLRAAGTDPFKIQEAKEFIGVIAEIERGIDVAGQEMAKFKESVQDVLVDSVGEVLQALTTNVRDLGDALKKAGENLLNSINKILTDIAARKIVEGVLGSTTGQSIFSIFGFAGGGPVPGSGEGDTVHAMLTPGEFVVRKDVVQQPGMLALLREINRGMPALRSFRRGLPAYASGGMARNLSDTPTGGTVVQVDMTVVAQDANSFRRSEDEIMAELYQKASTAFGRNR